MSPLPLVNESDRAQIVFGTSVNAGPVLHIPKLDPNALTDEQRAELVAVEALCPLPSDPSRRATQHRLNLAAVAERLAHRRFEADRAQVSAGTTNAVWKESIKRDVLHLLGLFADPRYGKDVTEQLVLDRLQQELADVKAQLWP